MYDSFFCSWIVKPVEISNNLIKSGNRKTDLILLPGIPCCHVDGSTVGVILK